MKISVIGTGYVGLVSGVCLAEKGNEVVCVDVDAAKVAMINAGQAPIHEKGLAELLRKHVGKDFHASTDLRAAVHASEVSIIAVGTPFKGEEIDLQYIRVVAAQIGAALRDKPGYHVVVVKSTVVPGTTRGVVKALLEEYSCKQAGVDFGLGMNPEFLREGEAVEDFLKPDRIVLGGIDERTLQVLDRVYQNDRGVEHVRTNLDTAEMIKYTANSLFATMISFANEIGNVCAATPGVDVMEVMRGVHLDRRISPLNGSGERTIPALTSYIEAGCGFGGSCFPKDVNAFIAYGRRRGADMRVLEAVMNVNKCQPSKVLALAAKHFSDFAGVRIAVLGLAFKPGTDDIRESPALPVIQELLDRRADVVVYDPIAGAEAERHFGAGVLCRADSLEAALAGVEAVILITRWRDFERIPELIAGRDPQPVVIDGRRLIPRSRVPRYEGIGIGSPA